MSKFLGTPRLEWVMNYLKCKSLACLFNRVQHRIKSVSAEKNTFENIESRSFAAKLQK